MAVILQIYREVYIYKMYNCTGYQSLNPTILLRYIYNAKVEKTLNKDGHREPVKLSEKKFSLNAFTVTFIPHTSNLEENCATVLMSIKNTGRTKTNMFTMVMELYMH